LLNPLDPLIGQVFSMLKRPVRKNLAVPAVALLRPA